MVKIDTGDKTGLRSRTTKFYDAVIVLFIGLNHRINNIPNAGKYLRSTNTNHYYFFFFL